MTQYFDRGFNQLTLGQVDHESGLGKASDDFQRVFQHLSLISSEHSYIIQINHYRQTAEGRSSLQYIFHYKLEMGGSLGEAHGHA